MTNEEIEKRFLFDIEMGLFNINKDCYGGPCFIFSEYNYGYFENIKKIISILKKNGYKAKRYYDTPYIKVPKFSRLSIIIDNKRKRYRRSTAYSLNYNFETKVFTNKIPDYVKRYKLK